MGSVMMKCQYLIAAASVLGLAACATPQENGFAAGRTVFDNPYVDPAAQPATDESGGLFYPGAGRYAFDSEGNRVELTRSERSDARERARLVAEQAEQNDLVREFDAGQTEMRPDPVPSAPPVATNAEPR